MNNTVAEEFEMKKISVRKWAKRRYQSEPETPLAIFSLPGAIKDITELSGMVPAEFLDSAKIKIDIEDRYFHFELFYMREKNKEEELEERIERDREIERNTAKKIAQYEALKRELGL